MKISQVVPSLLPVFLLCGCATVLRGTKDSVRIESDPPGATVILSNGMTGVTPVTLDLPRKTHYQVEFRKEGYKTQYYTIGPMLSKAGHRATAGNALIGGAIGGFIDGSTGAAYDLFPNPLVVKLPPVAPAKEKLVSDQVPVRMPDGNAPAGGASH